MGPAQAAPSARSGTSAAGGPGAWGQPARRPFQGRAALPRPVAEGGAGGPETPERRPGCSRRARRPPLLGCLYPGLSGGPELADRVTHRGGNPAGTQEGGTGSWCWGGAQVFHQTSGF